jgi:hypothetical protein
VWFREVLYLSVRRDHDMRAYWFWGMRSGEGTHSRYLLEIVCGIEWNMSRRQILAGVNVPYPGAEIMRSSYEVFGTERQRNEPLMKLNDSHFGKWWDVVCRSVNRRDRSREILYPVCRATT